MSGGATDPSRHFIAYASAKAALVRTTETVADEMKTFGMDGLDRTHERIELNRRCRPWLGLLPAQRAVPLASRISLRARRRMFDLFMQIAPTAETRVLDVGVTSDSFYPESNYFERLYPHPGASLRSARRMVPTSRRAIRD